MVRLLIVLFWISLIVGTYVTGNVLGNWVPHLHTHLVPRYAADPRPGWPFPFPEPDPEPMPEDRLQQFDLRFTRIFTLERVKLRGNFDIYNVFNGSSILSENAGFGLQWLTPYEIMGGRLFKFSTQFEF